MFKKSTDQNLLLNSLQAARNISSYPDSYEMFTTSFCPPFLFLPHAFFLSAALPDTLLSQDYTHFNIIVMGISTSASYELVEISLLANREIGNGFCTV